MMKFTHRFVFLLGFMGVLSVILTTTTVMQYVLEQRRTAREIMGAHAEFMRSSVSELQTVYDSNNPRNKGYTLLANDDEKREIIKHQFRNVKVKANGKGDLKGGSNSAVTSNNNTLLYLTTEAPTLLDDSREMFIRRKLAEHRQVIRKKAPRLDLYESSDGTLLPSWGVFHNKISQFELYNEDTNYIDKLLQDMANRTVINAEMKSGGTQLKILMTFSDEGLAVMKPMRFQRDKETLPDHFYFVDFERHQAEIASFHLDRILGFRRVPPCVGRIFNISRDLERFAKHDFKKTFFRSPAKNHCFHGVCSYYCDTSHAFCGNPDKIEGSLCTYLPSKHVAKRKIWRHPWKRSYSKHKKAVWESDSTYCSVVRDTHPYNSGRRLLDLIDLTIFDFLTGNMDRHHYETFLDFGNNTFILHLDQGRAFGKSGHDEMSIMAPLYQCCIIRTSTLEKLKFLRNSPVKLSDLLRKSLTRDSLNPVLLEPHLLALDRRLGKILKIVNACIKSLGENLVTIEDGF